MPRFAILTHDYPHWHWDFLLEAGDMLRAWRLDAEPETGRTVGATALPDHRLVYLDYEGPIGGGRGTVSRWDSGMYEAMRWEPGDIEVTLLGDRVRGRVGLTQIEGTNWRVKFGE